MYLLYLLLSQVGLKGICNSGQTYIIKYALLSLDQIPVWIISIGWLVAEKNANLCCNVSNQLLFRFDKITLLNAPEHSGTHWQRPLQGVQECSGAFRSVILSKRNNSWFQRLRHKFAVFSATSQPIEIIPTGIWSRDNSAYFMIGLARIADFF